MLMLKGQTALEYLMTYGWAILIVIIAIGALYALGLTKPCRWTGTQITGFTGGGFQVTAPRFDASDGSIVFDLSRIGTSTVTTVDVTATYKSATGTFTVGGAMAQGNTTAITVTGLGTQTAGDCFGVDVTVNYQEAGRAFTSVGKISGTIEA